MILNLYIAPFDCITNYDTIILHNHNPQIVTDCSALTTNVDFAANLYFITVSK
jgi:hypothetical protein